MAKKPTIQKTVETLNHDEAKRKNIPTAEHQSVIGQDEKNLKQIRYPRNADLDPQLVWRGKDEQDWSDLVVNAPPLYIQEKVHPKALIDDLLRQTKEEEHGAAFTTADLFADFDGIPKDVDKTEFYSHEQNWSNRMILGDSLQVMASLAEREGLRGKVQCIYFDPPYGIKFNSNFQWSTTSRDVKDGKSDHITREPEQVKAFRDTWKDGVHSYLTYLRDRLTVARDLLTETGSIFVQIGDENVHRVRALMDEVFGDENFISLISVQTTSGFETKYLGNMSDFVIWYARKKDSAKVRLPYSKKELEVGEGNAKWIMFDDFTYRGVTAAEKRKEVELPSNVKFYKPDNILSQGAAPEPQPIYFKGKKYDSWGKNRNWSVNYPDGMERLIKAGRIHQASNSIQYVRFNDDFSASRIGNIWTDTGSGNFLDEKVYVVQTNPKVIARCINMTSDPGDLILDPTCGSGTTATVSELLGRRWITIDTSRVAITLARLRIMGAKYPYYLLADSKEGLEKEAELRGEPISLRVAKNNLNLGFVYDRLPKITMKVIAQNKEIDIIWEKYLAAINASLKELNLILKHDWLEWEVPKSPDSNWPEAALKPFEKFWSARKLRQKDIDKSIASKAEFEYLYDRPHEDKKKVRVAGPFTVESLSPHRVLGVDENDNLIDSAFNEEIPKQSFTQMILDNLKVAGVQQSHKVDKIEFSSLLPWPGKLICAEGLYSDGHQDASEGRRAAIFIGPEFGTVQRADLVEAAREAGDAGFDALIACAFNYEAHATELNKLGSIPILKARMNADLHMSEDLKNTGKGNLFVIFGEPDINIIDAGDEKICIKVNGVDVFKPQTGEVVSHGADGIACWFIDSDYNEESFFVRQAYFLGANDPYNALKTTLKAEINPDAWATLNSDTSRPFPKPKSGRIAVKVINHLGDEVMKVFKV